MVVTIEEQQLRERLKAAGLDTGETISAGQARRLACNAGILLAVLKASHESSTSDGSNASSTKPNAPRSA